MPVAEVQSEEEVRSEQSDPKEVSLWKDALSRIVKSKTSLLGLVIITLLVVIAVFAPLIAPYHPIDDGSVIDRYQPPSGEHWLGTDALGRDIFSRIAYGARISIQIGVVAVGISAVVGILLGGISGYLGRWVDMVVMRFIDILMAFPSILLAIAMVAVLGRSLTNAMIAVGIVGVPQFARIVRSTVLSVKEKEFVEAARATGVKNGRILFRHVLPNCMAPIIVQTTLSIGTAILDAAGLSFLGLGAQGATPEWGAMLKAGVDALQTAPWVVMFPGLAILLVVLGFNLLGDGLRDALDPRLRQ
ncbi:MULTISPECIES: ABC transporter permease [Pontibacillus]|uniref:ABC transporter permease n=1 Tax=Pontibacillus chungwhensis TaxID=265426 RepID=A0ABY8UW55_9BACI|nr:MULTISPECIES: ABC transporter permease [Pontibacillus]MCD5324294.1 ABC transporter permease [Pontibacillus sp. HN14]WIF97653.1 ABC transporter permease [Pontibacillus chungwhensis]